MSVSGMPGCVLRVMSSIPAAELTFHLVCNIFTVAKTLVMTCMPTLLCGLGQPCHDR